jgi:transcriptional regulator with XRE-family HTH domain
MTDIVKAVGDRVRLYRNKAGLSQNDLGDLAGLHNTYIGQVERGEKNITIEGLEKIIKALGLSYEVFYAGIGHGGEQAGCAASECYNLILKMDDDEQRGVLDIIKRISVLMDK